MNIFRLFKSKDKKTVEKPIEKLKIKEGQELICLDKENYSKLLGRDIPKTDQFQLDEIMVNETEYFKANQTLFTLSSRIHGSGILYINLPYGGRIDKFLISKGTRINLKDELLFVRKIEEEKILNAKLLEQNRPRLDQTEVSYLEDEFTDDKTIKVTKLASEESEYFKLYLDEATLAYEYLGLSLVNHNGYVYASFNSRIEDMTLSKGDSLIMLFEDKSKLNFNFSNAGEGTKGFRFNHSPIGFEELDMLLNKRLVKVKLISARKKLYSIYHMNHKINENQTISINQATQYQTELEGQYLLQLITARFIEMNKQFKIK
ncbi:hypothetical protein MATR_27580 [Marivirga tractuosa]|uniref:Uncharacterized protein n=1 Tax=Marivirga tractuosa (strain ATCC 23168 / DSM 4126 / NBRC 15989 / NCIMB 1408 / VKM B-1430 / H-43) TaxID=643867 RepID=E4TLW3_MARTH|nr:hypothetical protein [Marivirga tractuosa]ADR23392.1 hypothetical protein Ftrac_3418 [Marivirga tractuosa DSM 4126]BDD15933.1 hypothetical protein MATR_27580 [Marivirga tractuosa]